MPTTPSGLPFHDRPATLEAESPADQDLMARYIFVRDNEAFALLVQRHGRMVLGVCRRVLHNHHDAEDACQDAFLILMRKARSLRSTDAVGGWLYGVAYRIALKARTAARRRRKREAAALLTAHGNAPDDGLREVLDRELDLLPTKHRVPVVLCYFEGKTKEEAARELRLPTGTVSARLARARERLRRRVVC